MTDLERCIETARVYRDDLFSCNPHPEERGVKLGISDQVAEEVLLRLNGRTPDEVPTSPFAVAKGSAATSDST